MFIIREVLEAITSAMVIFAVLVVATRVIGKKLLGQLTFFDFVTGITLGTIGGAFVTTQVKGYFVLISIVTLTLLVFLTGLLTLRNVTARKLIEGEPIVIIQNGKIFEKNMKKIRYNVDDLMMQLREKDVFNMADVEFAILEPHGKLSVQKKSQNLPLTPGDLNIPTDYKGICSEIIRDGRIQQKNLEQNSLSHEWLYNQLAARDIRKLDDVILASLSTDGSLYIDLRDDELSYIQRTEDDDSII